MNIIKDYFKTKKENENLKKENKTLEDNIAEYRRTLKMIKTLAEGNKCNNELLVFRKIAEYANEEYFDKEYLEGEE